MKSIVVRIILIIVALLTMVIAFVAVAQADSPPCGGGTGSSCDGLPILITPTPPPPCYDPDGNGICDLKPERSTPTPTSRPDDLILQHRLLTPVERVIKPLR